MAEIELKVEIRLGKGTKKVLSEMRGGRMIPAVVYGGKGANLSVAVGEGDLLGALKAGGANALLKLKHEKGEDTVIVKALQRHVVTSRPVHADFQRISLTEKIEVKVPIEIVGEAPGVKLQGGILEHVLRELLVRCLPNAIPQRIDADISLLNIGEQLFVSSLKAPSEVEVLADPKQIVVNVLVPAAEEEKPAEEVAAEGALAEPEVIAKGKEKGEEEGEAGEAKPGVKPEAGKPGAKPEAGKPAAGKKEEPKK
ncbi:MAG: 50S ribosomal protein L25 [Elusimicrobia bacterium]|nr:50S ribosomal protein L25 [Elusimicrobiota bacterium]